jgi:hypothetical protein
MSKGPPARGNRLVYVPEELVKELMKVSKSRGESVGRFIEDALRQALRVSEIGYDSKQLSDFFEVMQVQRTLGGAFVPLDVLNYMTSKTGNDEREQLQAKWHESGNWYGKYMREKFEDPVRALKIFLEASRWDLSEVEVKKDGEKVKLRCVSTVLTKEQTHLLANFIEGAMDGIGYKKEKTDCIKGMIVSEFRS